MGERIGLLISFLTVNWGLKPVRGGQDTYFRVKYMSEEWVFRWISYSWKLVLHYATVILFHYFSFVFFPIPLLWRVSHIIYPFPIHSHRLLIYHPTLHSSIYPTEHLFWFSVGDNGWKHFSEVFSTLMRLGKLL